MRVSDLAKELGITSDVILAKLKSFMLKAKDSKQELNSAVIVVLRRELGHLAKGTPKAKEAPAAVKVAAKEDKSPKKASAVAAAAEKPKAKKAIQEKAKEEKPKTAVKKTKKGPVEKTPSPRPVEKPVVEAFVSVKVQQPHKAEIPKAKEIKLPAPSLPQPKVEMKSKEKPLVRGETKPVSLVKAEPPKPMGDLEIDIPISVKDLAVRMQQKPSVVLKKLMEKGILATINQGLSEETVKDLAQGFGFTFTKFKSQEEHFLEKHAAEKEDPKLLKPRSPVVTFMGHVDHGKTSLLDKIRKTKVADKEHGGITQHIGAYLVAVPKGKIAFLDTPGHEAFTSMRARGAHITDLVVLVVAADEGIMPQTDEAIDHARAANVPIIVALNKIDKRGIDIDRVKKQLAERDLNPEDWGGKTIVVGVSALTGEGIDQLLEMILLEAELLELKANPDRKASGIVVEAKLSQGRGSIATVIVQNGTLRDGDTIIVGPHYGRIKAMLDDHERPIKEAGPAMPAEILGLSGVPEAGEKFYAIDDEKIGREIVTRRQDQIKAQKLQPTQKITLEDLYAQIKEGKLKELNIILKADVQGSLEALNDSLAKIPSDQIQLKTIHKGVGEINTSDIILAEASNAIVIGFNIDVGPRAKEEIEKRQVDVRTYRIIYDAINDIKNALQGLLEPKLKKKFLGRVEIRQVFKLSRSGIVAGCFVSKGKVSRKASIDIVRNGDVVFTGSISSLKRFKDDVREVAEGFECGITIQGFDAIESGDIVEAFEFEKIARTL